MSENFDKPAWIAKLLLGADQLGVKLAPEVAIKLAAYIGLLLHWNKAYNLTAIIVPDKIRTLHILDSLTLVPYLKGPYILDVGSGAGFPGIPLALVLPQYQFILLDSNSKKINFLRHVVRELALENIEVCQARAEEFNYNQSVNTIVTRATSDMVSIINATKHLICSGGQWLFMKGQYPADEIGAVEHMQTASKFAVTIATQCLKIPGEDVSRNLVVITNC